MRLCYFTQGYPGNDSNEGSGVGVYTYKIVNALQNYGWDPNILCLGPKRATPERNLPNTLWYTPLVGNIHYYASKIPRAGRSESLIRFIQQIEANLAFARGLASLIGSGACSFELLEVPNSGNLFLNHWKQISSIPYVVMVHGATLQFRRTLGLPISPIDILRENLELRFMRHAVAVYAPSTFTADYYRKKGIPAQRVSLPVQFASDLTPMKVCEPNTSTVLWVSTLNWGKGFDTFLKAIPLVVAQHANVHFVIVGYGTKDTVESMEQFLAENGVSQKVTYVGYVPWMEIANYFAACTLFVNASRCETFGQSIAEAMLAGKPVVACRNSAIPELVVDGLTGILVPTGDHAALADAVIRLLRDKDLQREMGQNGLERIRSTYHMDVVLPGYIQRYQSLLDFGQKQSNEGPLT